MPEDTILSLEMPPDIGFGRVLTQAAECLSQSSGLAQRESLRFQLAVDEFFTYLTQIACLQGPVKILLTGKTYQVRASIQFQSSDLSLRALNAGCTSALDGEGQAPRDLGLILAGRAADRFRLTRENHDSFILHAEVDKVYPAAKAPSLDLTLRPPYRVDQESTPGLLQHAASLAAARYPAWHCPASFQAPGKFADMAKEGHFSSVLALDASSHPAGLICWAKSGEKGLAFSGPFVFVPPADTAHVAILLTEAFLAAVARKNVEIVFSERATPDTPEGYFESLGTLSLNGPSGKCDQPVLYRHLREDTGETVWADPVMEGFLRGIYNRLAMCRHILPTRPAASPERQYSLFSTMMDKGKGLAVLRPLLDGEDLAANLGAHVKALAEKNVMNILLYMDLSQAWEANLAGPVMEAGFRPKMVIPHAGRSDVAVFQYAPVD